MAEERVQAAAANFASAMARLAASAMSTTLREALEATSFSSATA
jgi:hypothetical protein